MDKQYEVVSSTVSADPIMATAMERSIQRRIDRGEEASDLIACADCRSIALCGLIAIDLDDLKSVRSSQGAQILSDHGVEVKDDAFCAGPLVSNAKASNETNTFWLLQADELNSSSLEIRTAQTIIIALGHIRQRLNTGTVK